ncbi:MFS transporter [Arthrobacter sp. BL-252-APC-1A]|uniref:MFS transporter n=1 Tax=Arthrobacter sp. BL-252-APC-1A TaxID=2606622 RepID=UPI0012B281EE|nr:MFS transporter [Arthrobacter sp. BL-252-APC-1A]MSR97805.1 MFS transporter [Arthrobacter sp. BL-252-APC-1A]
MTAAAGTGRAAGRGVGAILSVLVFAEIVAAFETSMAVQLLYAPGDFFTSDLSQLVWVITAYSLVAAMATGFVGRLGDQFGRRKVLVVILLLSAIGSVISALAPSFAVLVAGRALQGVSGAVLPLAIGVVRATFPQAKISMGIAVVSTSALLAGAAGMLGGGLFLDYATWHYIFWTAAVAATVAAALVHFGVAREPRDTLAAAGRIDYFGGLLFGAAIASVLYGLTLSKDRGWTDVAVLAFVVGGLAILALWIKWELRTEEPMVNVRMFRERKFALGMLATALIAIGPIGTMNILTVTIYRNPSSYLTADGTVMALPVGLGLSATMTGLLGFITAAAAFCISPLIGRISARFGARVGLMIGSLLTIAGLLIVCIAPGDLATVITGLVVVVLGTGFLYSGMPTVIVECVLPEQTSTATAINAVVRTAFQAVSASIVGLMLAFSPVVAGENAFVSESGFYLSVGALIVTCILTIIVVFFIPPTRVPNTQGSKAQAASLTLKD